MKKFILWAVVLTAFFGFLMVIDKPNTSSSTAASGGKLMATKKAHDFGNISMKDGKVKYTYEIKNTSDKPVTITKLYTSCMCTTAELTTGSQKAGPFGMQGHGGNVPDISLQMQPGH